jgi:hypothetical protein
MSKVRAILALVVMLACAPSALAAARICMSADTFSFGQQQVGTSTSQSMVVANCGDASFSFTDVAPDAANKPGFRIVTSCTTGMMLDPGAECGATVYFEPKAPGQVSGGLWFRNTTSTPDLLLTFYGRGIDAQAGTATLEFAPPLADFGSQAIGVETGPIAVALNNAGAAPLVPSAFVLNGVDPYDFSGDMGSGASACGIGKPIAPGGSCTLHLYFAPQATGSRTATLVVDAPQLATLAFFTLEGNGVDASSTISVIEYHDSADDQYFLTADANEIALLDSGDLGPGWSRTGATFGAWPVDASDARALPVCRFFGVPGVGPDSHFYTAYPSECDAVRNNPYWIEEGVTFREMLPVNGACADGFDTVQRLWKPGAAVVDTRHRYVIDPSIASAMQAQGWVLEGPVFCAPSSQ